MNRDNENGRIFKLQTMPEKLQSGQDETDRLLQCTCRSVCCKGGTAYVGRTMYFREKWFGDSVFLRLQYGLCLLSK